MRDNVRDLQRHGWTLFILQQDPVVILRSLGVPFPKEKSPISVEYPADHAAMVVPLEASLPEASYAIRHPR
jgi:hypothetical protein